MSHGGAEFSKLELHPDEATQVCRDLAGRLGLQEGPASDLVHASESGWGDAELFLEERAGSVVSTRLVTYRLWRDKASQNIVLVYGVYVGEFDLDVAFREGGPPADHCVEKEGRIFSVLPWRPPGDPVEGNDMVNETDDTWTDIPAGWRPYEVCDDFDRLVRPNVIAAFPWGTDVLLVRKGKNFPAWRTGMYKDHGGSNVPGKRFSTAVDWFEVDKAGERCVWRAEEVSFTPSKKLTPVFRPWCGRLLMERFSQSEQLQAWQTFLKLTAQSEWWAATGA